MNIVPLVALLLIVVVTTVPTPSNDLWWLLAQGRWIVEHGQLPLREPFSFLFQGGPWHNDQWLASLIFFGLYSLGGLTALQLLKWLLLSLGLWLQWPRPLGVVAVAWAALCLSLIPFTQISDLRAYLFTYLWLSLWWRWLRQDRLDPRWLALTAVIWANQHAGILVGLALLGLAAVAGHPGLRRRPWLVAVAALASLVNPSGLELHLHFLKLMGEGWNELISEWKPLTQFPSYLWPYLGLCLTSLGLLRRDPRPLWDRLCIAATLLLPFSAARHLSVSCWALVPLGERLKVREPVPVRRLALAALLVAAAVRLTGFQPEALSMVRLQQPVGACEFLRASADRLPHRLFHDYAWGGYLIFRCAPPYQVLIDGRAAQVYPPGLYREILESVRSPLEFQRFLDRYQLHLAMLSTRPDTRYTYRLLQDNPVWVDIYHDEHQVLFLRQSP